MQEGGFRNSCHAECLPDFVFTPCLSGASCLLFFCLRWSSPLLSLLAEPCSLLRHPRNSSLDSQAPVGRALLSFTALTALCYNCLFVSSPCLLLEGMDQAFLCSLTGTGEAFSEYLWTDCPLGRREAWRVGSTSKLQKRYL